MAPTACMASRGSSSRVQPRVSASETMRPVMWWASRKGMLRLRTSQSARSVAVEKPAPATAAMRSGTGSRSLIMPGVAASTISMVSAASKSCSLSSCMSLE